MAENTMKTSGIINQDFEKIVKEVQNKIDKQILTDYDIMVLACNEIAHTYTQAERGYSKVHL